MYTYEELYHYGIKGMKWGVRRTPEQLGQRFKKTKEDIAAKKAARDKETHDKVMKSRNAKYIYRNRRLLSDEELRTKLNRVQMEANLRQAAYRKVPLKETANAAREIAKAAKIVGGVLAAAKAAQIAAKVATGNPTAVSDIVSSALAGSTTKLIWGA